MFFGVRSIAETASILNPDRKVLLPNPYAGCELTEICTANALEKERKRHPDAAVVSYVNIFSARFSQILD